MGRFGYRVPEGSTARGGSRAQVREGSVDYRALGGALIGTGTGRRSTRTRSRHSIRRSRTLSGPPGRMRSDPRRTHSGRRRTRSGLRRTLRHFSGTRVSTRHRRCSAAVPGLRGGRIRSVRVAAASCGSTRSGAPEVLQAEAEVQVWLHPSVIVVVVRTAVTSKEGSVSSWEWRGRSINVGCESENRGS